MKEVAQQRAARAKKAMAARKEAEKERQKREFSPSKKHLLKRLPKKIEKQKRNRRKNLVVIVASGHFLTFIKRKSNYNEEVEKNMIFLSTSILFLREQQHEK